MFTHKVVGFPLLLAYFHMDEITVDFNNNLLEALFCCDLLFVISNLPTEQILLNNIIFKEGIMMQ